MDIARFIKNRPFLYHLTARENLAAIIATQELLSAAAIFAKAGNNDLCRNKRHFSVPLMIGSDIICVRDQAPLYAGNCKLQPGWSFEDLVELLNSHVFFWPGTASGPIDYGQRHFLRYVHEKPIVIRVGTDAVFTENAMNGPRVCRYNSGAPRCTQGKGSPRGPGTFQNILAFAGTVTEVKEVTFQHRMRLPLSVEIADSPAGPWKEHRFEQSVGEFPPS